MPTTSSAEATYRPQFHFTTPSTWINDPNGLIRHRGRTHVFFQTNPFGPDWGNMSWGHAVSDDLVRWEHLPIALPARAGTPEGTEVGIFSGTVAAPSPGRRIAGVPEQADLVACYTAHVDDGRGGVVERQELAWSCDDGRTWTLHPDNPVLDLGRRDFRDPRLFFDEALGRWAMLVAVPHERAIESYTSADGIAWHLTGTVHHAADDGIVECPDLAVLPVEGTGEHRWVLLYSVGYIDDARSGRVVHRIGTWEAGAFRPDDDVARTVDAGRDFYACQLVAGIPAGEPALGIAWAGGSPYTGVTPTTPWRGVLSMPRRFWLARHGEALELRQLPAEQLTERFTRERDASGPVDGGFVARWRSPVGGDRAPSGIRICDTAGGVLEVRVGSDRRLAVDRRKAGHVDFHPLFAGVDQTEVLTAGDGADGPVDVEVFVDASIVEAFAAGGRAAITSLCYLAPGPLRVETFGAVQDLRVHGLADG